MVYSVFLMQVLPRKNPKILHHLTFSSFTRKYDHEVEEYSIQGNTPKYLYTVAERVVKEYNFHSASCSKQLTADDFFRIRDGDAVPQLYNGIFVDQEEEERCVLWQGGFTVVFVMICHKNENKLLIKKVSELLIKTLQNKIQAFTSPSEIIQRPDRVNVIIKSILPNGLLSAINGKIYKSIDREIENRST